LNFPGKESVNKSFLDDLNSNQKGNQHRVPRDYLAERRAQRELKEQLENSSEPVTGERLVDYFKDEE
jgi:hypothetical protein